MVKPNMTSVEVSGVEFEVTNEMVIDFMLGKDTDMLGLYPDGSYYVEEWVGHEAGGEEQPLLALRCVGKGNHNYEHYARDWAQWDEDLGMWKDMETGEYMDDDTMISKCIEEGDGSGNEDLAKQINVIAGMQITLEDPEAKDEREEFRALGYEAREYTVRPGAGNQSSGRINVPKAWEGKRVLIIRLE